MSQTPPVSLSVIGYGHMGQAILGAWLQSDLISDCTIYGANGANNDKITYKPRYTNETAEPITSDILLIAVKPQDASALLTALKDKVSPNTCVLSVMAGISTQRLRTALGEDTAVIRAMPNLPALIGQGATALYAAPTVSIEHKTTCEALISCLGTTAWLENEGDMHAVTGLSGSGPGYAFHFVDALAQAGIQNGLNAQTAYTLAKQTVIGSAALLAQSPDKTANELRDSVASKGGTTEAGLNILMNDLDELLKKTVEAATERSIELSKD